MVETAKAVLKAGGIGMNLEDAGGDPALQVEKVQAIRQAAAAAGIPLVINARTDVYLRQFGDPAARFDEAVRRANLYAGLSTTGVGTQKSFYDRARFDREWSSRGA